MNPNRVKNKTLKHLFLIIITLLTSLFSFSQETEIEEILSFQKELNHEYADSLSSPLTRADRLVFKGHDFYPIDIKYKVHAEFVKTPDEKPFKMATTKGQPRDYVKYGEVRFTLNEKPFKLNVYQSLDLVKQEAYINYLFLPFRDFTNDYETYGGGRFIDLMIPKDSIMVIDFNKAYNPYCLYNTKYSCPITPVENFIETDVKAGIKSPKDH